MFSEREQKIINIIGRKRMTLTEITSELYMNVGRVPFDTVISTGNSVIRIIKKCDYHELEWTLTKKRENSKLTIKKEKV